LRRLVGNAEVMAAQLDRLIECARPSGIVLQVAPFNAGDHPGTDGPITVYEFSDRLSVVYAECKRGGRIIEDPEEVADMIGTMHMARAAALSPRDSLALMEQIRSELDD
jgi:hypothetical protein